MKTKIYYPLFLILLFSISCSDPGGEPIFDGFTFRIWNFTDEVYEGEIVIGSFKNENFIAIDSIKFERKLQIGGAALLSHFIRENSWKPDLDKIRNVPSNRCFFKLKLSNGRSGVLTRYNSEELFSLLLPQKKHFRGEYGELFLNIEDTQLTGGAVKEF